MDSCGIYLDNNVVIAYCLERRLPGFSLDFIGFLERNPKLGLITSRVENRILKRLRKTEKAESQGYCRFDELQLALKKEEVDKSEFEKNLKTVGGFFYKLAGRKKYTHNPFSNLGKEDVERLAEAVCIEPNYSTLFFASLDKDFVTPHISRQIENKFKIKCRYPIDILKEIEINI